MGKDTYWEKAKKNWILLIIFFLIFVCILLKNFWIVVSILIIIFILFIIYFLVGKKQYGKIAEILLIILFTGIISNQAVQPLIMPVIDTIETTPMYVQGENDHYYEVSKINYVINLPLIPIYNKIKIDFPEYSEILPDYLEYSPDIKYTDLNPLIIKINNNAWHLRSISINVWVKNEIKALARGTLQTTLPRTYPAVEISLLEGRGCFGCIRINKDTVYRICEGTIKNKGDILIKNYHAEVGSDKIYCDENGEFTKEILQNRTYISLDLKPREIKKILFLIKDQVSACDFIYNALGSRCNTAWKLNQGDIKMNGVVKIWN